MSTRLDPAEERLALSLLENALAREPTDPAAYINRASEYDRLVRDRALALLRAASQGSASMRTGGATSLGVDEDDQPLPERIGEFEVVELLGRGGMGAVYKARRAKADFDHEVAIKIIRPGIISDSLSDRFRRERQILAGLRHRNITQLYDGGETQDGAPYIVMELVDGISLSRWLKRAEPSLETRLTLMLQICDAVEFAHQNLIVHRDLTPGNVLVTEGGEAKLIDFGIARPQESNDTPQALSSLSALSLTPGFAAPERQAGGPVTTLADIFSLGRIFAIMLKGFDEPELIAIADRASAERPEDRYAGAALMAQDIARFRNREPVGAYSNETRYRVRKYLARHRLPVALAGLAAFLLVAGLVGVTDAYRDASAARDNAEQRFNEVRALSNFLLFDLYDELEDVPGTTQALNDIADRARHYLDVLSQSEGANAEVRLEAALAYKRLSDVLGTPIAANLGRREEAGETLALAIAQLRQLRSEVPADEAINRGLAEALYSQAVYAFISLDDNELAHEAASESAEIFWRLAEEHGRETYAPLAIDAEIEAGQPLAWIGRGAEAVEMQKATLEKMEAHIAAFGATPDNLGLLARTESTLSETIGRLADTGEASYEEALQHGDRAVATYRQYVAQSERPDGPRRSMAVSLYKRSLILYSLMEDARALADIEEAEAIIADLSRRDPEDSGLVRTLAAIQEQKAVTLAHAGRGSEAIALARQSMIAKRTASNAEPDNPGLLRDLGSNLLLLAEVAELAGSRSDACAAYRQGAEIYERLDSLNGLSEFDEEVVLVELPEALARTC